MGKEVINSPLLSVIIPCFNAAPYLRQCVENLSVICPYEIIIVDDGSTDDTRTIGLELQSQHNYIRLVSQGNKGASVARLEGWKKSAGEYVIFLDVDDKIIVSEDVTSLLNGRYDVIKTAGYYVNGGVIDTADSKPFGIFSFTSYWRRSVVQNRLLFRLYIAVVHILQRLRGKGCGEMLN